MEASGDAEGNGDEDTATNPLPEDQPQSVQAFTPEGVEENKALGNEKFRAGDIESASEHYLEALKLLDVPGAHNPVLRAALLSNRALCLLKLNKYGEAEECASSALVTDPANGKATYRRGLARLQLGDVRGAHEDLQKAVRLEPQNREVRQRCEEARKLVESMPVDTEEVALASNATNALGKAGSGLYEEKPDLNEGRLAETHAEQREWIKTIEKWDEIKEVSFAEDEKNNVVSVYMALSGVQNIEKNKVCVWMTPNSLEVRVVDLQGSNWFWIAQELWGQIEPENSSWKVKRDKVVLKLQKRSSARTWDRWQKLRRI